MYDLVLIFNESKPAMYDEMSILFRRPSLYLSPSSMVLATSFSTGFVRGPINQGELSYTYSMIVDYIPLFLGLILILYIAGLFIAKSISNSASNRWKYYK